MSATMVASETKAVSSVVSSIQDILLAKIRESKSNPRRFFDEAKLAELADFVPGNKIPHYVALGVLCPPLGATVSLAEGRALQGT
jgi:hypothetical protein